MTGASTNAWPAARSRSSSSRAVPGAIVDMSTNSVSSRAPSSAWPIMSSTWAPSTTIVITTSEASATARGESATVPPCSATHASAFSRVRLKTVSS